MRRLIVNADDFGMTPGVSAGILAAARHGIVTSTTALVTGTLEAAALAAALDVGLGVGLHVNITLGRPLTGASSLTGPDGRFVRDARLATARARVEDVEREVAAQLERFTRLAGRLPTHLDSHHHAALHAPVGEVVLAAAARLALPVRAEDPRQRARARSLGLRAPDCFIGGSGPAPAWTRAVLLAALGRLGPGTTEFMTHPGWFDAELGRSRYGRQREWELAALGSADARGSVHALGVVLTTFAAL